MRMKSLRPCFALLLALLFASSGSATAQQAAGRSSLQWYTFSDAAAVGMDQVQLWASPFGGGMRVHPLVNVSVTGAFAEGLIDFADGGQAWIGGLTDTQMKIEVHAGRFLVAGTAVLPTGDETMTFAEASVVGIISSGLLPFAITNWGRGGGFGGDIGYSFESDRLAVALTAGLASGKNHALVEGEPFLYRPGTQGRLRAVIDVDLQEASTLSLLLGMQRSASDAYEGLNAFRPGLQLEGVLSYGFPLGARESVLAYAGLYQRSGGVVVLAESDPSFSQFPGALDSASRQLLVAGLEMRLSRRRYDIVPEAELRLLRSNDGVGQGWLASFGGDFDYRVVGGRLGQRVVVTPSLRLRLGHIRVRKGQKSSVTGWQVGLTVRFQGNR